MIKLLSAKKLPYRDTNTSVESTESYSKCKSQPDFARVAKGKFDTGPYGIATVLKSLKSKRMSNQSTHIKLLQQLPNRDKTNWTDLRHDSTQVTSERFQPANELTPVPISGSRLTTDEPQPRTLTSNRHKFNKGLSQKRNHLHNKMMVALEGLEN